jgi:23S rRNA pseudouridine2605 synthase
MARRTRSGSARASTDTQTPVGERPVRVQRYLAEAGVGSRRFCDGLVAEGRVRVNGRVAPVGLAVRPGADLVELDGRPVESRSRPLVVALNKPAGFLSACRRTRERGRLVTELVPIAERLYPAGRLDRESEGLVVLTNCGELAQYLTHPRSAKEKEYRVWLDREPTDDEVAMLERGVELEDGPARPRSVTRCGARCLQLVLTEGRKRQVRRMVAAVGNRATRLRRTRIAGLSLGRLKPGEWRLLEPAEVRERLWPGFA